jgi:hypothetical protein
MDLLKNLQESIARAKAEGRTNLVEMLEYRLEALQNPVSAQATFMSGPMSIRMELS